MARLKNTVPILHEDELRAYMKCSQYHHFGGRGVTNKLLMVAKGATERTLSFMLKDELVIPTPKLIAESVEINIKRLELTQESQIIEWRDRTNLALSAVFQHFPPDRYLAVYGPLPFHIKLSKSILQINVSGVFKQRDKNSIHFLYWGPYTNDHAILNDPIANLLARGAWQFIRKMMGVPYTFGTIHIFNFDENLPRLGPNAIPSGHDPKDFIGLRHFHMASGHNPYSRNYIEAIEGAIRGIENKYHIPLVPCPHLKCQFRKICRPLVIYGPNPLVPHEE